jgi:hypothetical protein
MKKRISSIIALAVIILLTTGFQSVERYGGGVFTSISAATATGAGNVVILSQYQQSYTWTTNYTGTPTSITQNLEGSLDLANWFTLDSSTSTSSEMRHVVNKPVLALRCNIAAYVVNGSTATCKLSAFAAAR